MSIISPLVRHSKSQAKVLKDLPTEKGSVLLLSGCVQPGLAPNINSAATQVLYRLGYKVLKSPNGECCGAIDEHLSAQSSAITKIKHNLDTWCTHLDNGVHSIISTASGCGVMVKDYSHFFVDDALYLAKAKRVIAATKDIAEFLLHVMDELKEEELTPFMASKELTNAISLHTPCTMQHGQKLPNTMANLLVKLGYKITRPKDDHLCCGSAGTYSIFQSEFAKKLQQNKLTHLQSKQPELIVTANIGCLMHLQKGTRTPIKHWVELLAQ